jgi:O-antigen/teichoic acid export membrane protein
VSDDHPGAEPGGPVTGPLPSRRRTVLATLSGSTLVTAIVAVQAIVLAPLFLRELGAPLYGAWLASGELLVWILAFDLGLPNLLIQRIGAAHARGDARAIGEYLAAGLLVLGVIGLVLAAAVLLLAPLVPPLMRLSGEEAQSLAGALRLAGVATAGIVATNAVVGFSRGVQQTGFMSAATVVSVLAGFITTLMLLLAGWGLWAAALGVATRCAIVVVSAASFVALHLRHGLGRHVRVRWRSCRELLSISPVTALGGLAHAGMAQSETALVAILGRPDLAAAYALTRRAVDLARILIDVIGTAAYGSFAHLVASPDRARSLAVHAEISTLRLSLAVAAAGAYVAVNASLVGAWVGPEQYLGLALTTLFAVHMIVAGQGHLLNYLYRATGAVAPGSWMMLAEALVRVPLMVVLFHMVGVFGLPLAGILTAAVFGAVALSRTCRDFADVCPPRPSASWSLTLARGAVLLAGCALGVLITEPSWVWVGGVGLGFALLAVPALFALDPLLAATLAGARAAFPLGRAGWSSR